MDITDTRTSQLMLAAYHSHANIVRFLIHHGADPNTLNDRQQSPLAGAVFKKEDDVIEVCSSNFSGSLYVAADTSAMPIGFIGGRSRSRVRNTVSYGVYCHVQTARYLEGEI